MKTSHVIIVLMTTCLVACATTVNSEKANTDDQSTLTVHDSQPTNNSASQSPKRVISDMPKPLTGHLIFTGDSGNIILQVLFDGAKYFQEPNNFAIIWRARLWNGTNNNIKLSSSGDIGTLKLPDRSFKLKPTYYSQKPGEAAYSSIEEYVLESHEEYWFDLWTELDSYDPALFDLKLKAIKIFLTNNKDDPAFKPDMIDQMLEMDYELSFGLSVAMQFSQKDSR